ncbi:hypothetical protein [Yersinia rochesterensis]|uniref:hypothetical protein n=1 Tax=Yersinia rochesterensis TaxID=1604335 RepID=UPI0016439F9D|nr:hypothetical protein [Yersinia rochesterensis]
MADKTHLLAQKSITLEEYLVQPHLLIALQAVVGTDLLLTVASRVVTEQSDNRG